MPLPAKCPELNPVENVWQFMRENWLSNRVFESYDAILEHCCDRDEPPRCARVKMALLWA